MSRSGGRKKSDDRHRGESSSRHDRKDRKKHHSSSSRHEDDDADERLLKQAKEFIEQEKKKKKDTSTYRSKRRSKSPDAENEHSSRKRHQRDDKDDSDEDRKSRKRSHSSRDDRKSSKRKSRRHDDVSDEDDRGSRDDGDSRSDRKKHKSSTSSRRDHHSKKSRSRDRKHEKESKKDHHKHRSKKDDRKEKDHRKSSSCTKKKSPSTKPVVKKPDKSKLTELGPSPTKPPTKLLDAERDYFAYHQSLWVWLYREEGMAFNDMTSEESRNAFAKFVQQYNAGQLEAAYYDPKGLPPAAVEECQTTRHKWNFQTSETERQGLKMLEDGVRKVTVYSDTDATNNTHGGQPLVRTDRKPAPTVAPRPDHDTTDHTAGGRRRPWTEEERMANREANKRLKQHVRTAEEEMSGGAADYGRERQIEKRKEVATRTHGAARDRDDPGMTLNDNALYGDGGHGASFQAALAREKERKSKREELKQARVQELQQKEQDKQKAMLDMLGLAGIAKGQKIKIAPRNDSSGK